MKKIIILITFLLMLCSCEQRTPQQIEKDRRDNYSNICQNCSTLIELTFKDEYGEKRTHEFVILHRGESLNGMTHWPDCKYCKERGL